MSYQLLKVVVKDYFLQCMNIRGMLFVALS